MLPNWNHDDCDNERPRPHRPRVIFCLYPTGATGGITGPTG